MTLEALGTEATIYVKVVSENGFGEMVITFAPGVGSSAEAALGYMGLIVKSQYIWKGNIVKNGFSLEGDEDQRPRSESRCQGDPRQLR